jgi:hypothetical protein
VLYFGRLFDGSGWSLPGLGIGMTITDFPIDGTSPSSTNKTDRNGRNGKTKHICRELVDRFSVTSGSSNTDVSFALIDHSWFSDSHLNQ